MSYNRVEKDAVTKMLPFVSDNFIKVIDAEIQEKVICHGLEMFGLWSVFFSNQLDANIVQWFKKGLGNKSQMVKISYLQWFLNCLHQTDVSLAADFKSELLKIVEKASQNVNQTPILCEGLAAACIILSITPSKEESLQSFWNIILDMKKEIFISEKFISSIASESLCNLLIMSEKLLNNFYEDLKGEPVRLFKCILQAATSNVEKVRTKAIDVIQRLISNATNGTLFGQKILNELTNLMEKSKITLENHDETDENDHSISALTIINILFTVCSSNYSTEKEIQTIINHAILAMHHDSIFTSSPELLKDILCTHQLNEMEFITENWTDLQEIIFETYKSNSMYQNAISVICFKIYK